MISLYGLEYYLDMCIGGGSLQHGCPAIYSYCNLLWMGLSCNWPSGFIIIGGIPSSCTPKWPYHHMLQLEYPFKE